MILKEIDNIFEFKDIYMKNTKAFTLAEVLIGLTIIIALTALTTTVVRNIGTTQNKLAIKKANQTIHEVVQNIIDDGSSYVGGNDFSDLSRVVIELDSRRVNTLGVLENVRKPVEGYSKFQSIFYSKMKFLQDPFGTEIPPECVIMVSNTATNSTYCYQTGDGMLWSVPLTDFREYNVVEIEKNGYTTPYVPVTVYVNYEKLKNKPDFSTNRTYFNKYAVLFAVRQDGDIRVVTFVDCNRPENRKHLQCIANEVVSDASF